LSVAPASPVSTNVSAALAQTAERKSSLVPFKVERTHRSLISALLQARGRFGGKKIALWDADDRQLTYDEIVRAAFALGSALRKFAKRKETVGIMLPTGAGAVLSFFAIHAFGRIPAMLNFTSGLRNLRGACGILITAQNEERFVIACYPESILSCHRRV